MEEEKIIVTKETVAEVMKKIDNGEELTTKDKIILQNNPEPVNVKFVPRIFTRGRGNGYMVDFCYWYEVNQWSNQNRQSIIGLVDEFMPALQSLRTQGQGLFLGGSNGKLLYKLYNPPTTKEENK